MKEIRKTTRMTPKKVNIIGDRNICSCHWAHRIGLVVSHMLANYIRCARNEGTVIVEPLGFPCISIPIWLLQFSDMVPSYASFLCSSRLSLLLPVPLQFIIPMLHLILLPASLHLLFRDQDPRICQAITAVGTPRTSPTASPNPRAMTSMNPYTNKGEPAIAAYPSSGIYASFKFHSLSSRYQTAAIRGQIDDELVALRLSPSRYRGRAVTQRSTYQECFV